MKTFALFAGLLLGFGASAQTTQTVPINGTASIQIPPPVPGPVGTARRECDGACRGIWTCRTHRSDGRSGRRRHSGCQWREWRQRRQWNVAQRLLGGHCPGGYPELRHGSGNRCSGSAARAPACGAAPASSTATMACPAGTTGSWTQTTTYASAAAPTCWTPVASPTAAPAGACTASCHYTSTAAAGDRAC